MTLWFRIEDTVFCVRCMKELHYSRGNYMERSIVKGSVAYHTHHCDDDIVLRFERKKKLDAIR